MPRLRTLAACALLVATVAALASCVPPDHTLDDGTHVIVAEPQPEISSLWMFIEGTLVVTGGCVGIDRGDFGGPLPVVFPSGTTVDGDDISVAGFDEPFELGDQLSGTGGTVPVNEGRHPDAPCEAENVVALDPGRVN